MTATLINMQGGNISRPPQSGPPEGTDMELPERIARVEAVIPYLATRADVEVAARSVVMWLATLIVSIVGVATAIMIFAIPKMIQAQQPQPPVTVNVAAPPPATPATKLK